MFGQDPVQSVSAFDCMGLTKFQPSAQPAENNSASNTSAATFLYVRLPTSARSSYSCQQFRAGQLGGAGIECYETTAP